MDAPISSWLLDERTGWRTGSRESIGFTPGAGLRLAVAPDGPLALGSADGSLGGLTLPRGMAVDPCGIVYLLVTAGRPRLLRFDRQRRHFFPLPEELWPASTLGANIAAAGELLYVADPGRAELSAWDGASFERLHRFGGAWEPVDVAAHGGAVYVLDRAAAAVHRHRLGGQDLERRFAVPSLAGRAVRIALDREERIYLWDGRRLAVFDEQGRELGTVADSDEVRSRFAPPAVRLDPCDRFRLPAAACCPAAGPEVFFRDGSPAVIEPAEPAGPALYASTGTWISGALDSEIDFCEWHRIELELGALPPGGAVKVSTCTDQLLLPDEVVAGLPGRLWRPAFAVTGPMQPPPGAAAAPPAPRREEGLAQSGAGRYLWVRLDLEGDGYATPVVREARLHYPRETWRQYLPAVFSADGEARSFLDRFLSLFQTEWDGLEQHMAQIVALFAPRSVPEPFLAWLAGWLGQPLEPDWDAAQNRRLLAAVPGLLPRRGTPAALRRILSVYLENLTGIPAGEHRGAPVIVEGFRMRRHLALAGERGQLGLGGALGGMAAPPRLRLGGNVPEARLGEARVTSLGDPRLDATLPAACSFHVYVPSAWVRTAGDETRLRRAVDREKPAPARWELCLVEPRLRVGVQATVGIDTVIGGIPPARLARPEPDAPPARPPRYRLGYDSVLGEGRQRVPAPWPDLGTTGGAPQGGAA